MRKGMTGKILTFVISMVLALLALAILWIVLSGAVENMGSIIPKITTGIKCGICRSIGLGALCGC